MGEVYHLPTINGSVAVRLANGIISDLLLPDLLTTDAMQWRGRTTFPAPDLQDLYTCTCLYVPTP